MKTHRLYSHINLTSLLDVVFLTLYLLVLTMGDNFRMTTESLNQRTQRAEGVATVALVGAEATATAAHELAQRAAQATIDTTQLQARQIAVTATAAALVANEQSALLATRM